ncbi:hypothetical protein PG988_000754 [Apiospora saccharicola]
MSTSPSILCNVDPEKYLAIIAEEVGISRDELHDDTEFADLGLDRVLVQAITDRFADETSQRLEVSVFESCPDVRSFMRRLDKTVAESTVPEKGTVHVPIEKMMKKKKKKNAARTSPLVLPLQGNPATAKKTLFLLPDGSGGSGPFLGAGPFSTTIEEMSATFTAAIREAQPHGPYNLGGWSAGGYFATEVARSLLRAGEAVERVLLIDSPCRVEYEAMPIEVVRFLAPRNLMGNWGDKKAGTPQWLVDHFEGTLAAVAEYEPGPIIEGRVANVFVVEASQAVFGTQAELQNAQDIIPGVVHHPFAMRRRRLGYRLVQVRLHPIRDSAFEPGPDTGQNLHTRRPVLAGLFERGKKAVELGIIISQVAAEEKPQGSPITDAKSSSARSWSVSSRKRNAAMPEKLAFPPSSGPTTWLFTTE